MKFGKSAAEAESEPSRGGSGGDFMKYLRAGDNTIHVLDEPDQWKYYWEHFNPDGYPYPCNSDDRANCPGCQSDNERVSKASRRVAFNAWDGEYVNIWKIPKTVADKLKMRYDRIGTITDRDYLITQYKKDNGFFDYEVEGQEKSEVPDDVEDKKRDPEDLLQIAWEENWGTSSDNISAKPTSKKAQSAKGQHGLKIVKEEQSTENKKYTEDELRAMEPWELVELCKKEGFPNVPKKVAESSDKIVDWMLEQ
jgi:hypothetical protein